LIDAEQGEEGIFSGFTSPYSRGPPRTCDIILSVRSLMLDHPNLLERKSFIIVDQEQSIEQSVYK